MSVPAHPASISFVRKAMSSVGDVCGDAVADVLALIFTELVTNSIRHAGVGSTQSIEICLDLRTDTVRGSVTDPGAGFETAGGRPVPDADGGYGLFIVERLASRWGVARAAPGTEVWFELSG